MSGQATSSGRSAYSKVAWNAGSSCASGQIVNRRSKSRSSGIWAKAIDRRGAESERWQTTSNREFGLNFGQSEAFREALEFALADAQAYTTDDLIVG